MDFILLVGLQHYINLERYYVFQSLHRLGITDQHYALITTPLFITQAPTCFGIHVPSSGSFLYPYELLERQNGYVVVMYCKCWWPVCTGCCSFMCYVGKHNT
jgi:hypothetical protein